MRSFIYPNANEIMKKILLLNLALGFLFFAPNTHAATRTSANYSITTESIDGAGVSTSSTNYSSTGSLGGITGIAAVASPAETVKSGYIGQLYQVIGLSLAPTFVDNGTTQQLLATQSLDDGTMIMLVGNNQSWSVVAGSLPSGLTLSPTTGVISGTPTGSSTYSFTILVTDGLGDSAQQVFSSKLTFAQWEAQFPALTDLSPNDTPQNDGVPTLLKYLYDLNPTQPVSNADRSALASAGLNTISGSQYLTLTFREYALITGMTINLQASTDLHSWTTISPTDPTYVMQTISTDPGSGDSIVQVGVQTAGAPRKFIRLNLTMP